MRIPVQMAEADGKETFSEAELFGSDEEADLFGDGDEGSGSGSQPQSTPQPGSTQLGTSALPDDPDEEDLFGSEDEATGAPAQLADDDERDLFGSEAGSDVEGAPPMPSVPTAEPSQPAAGTPREGAPSEAELSEMDERDIFGDMSDEEMPDKTEDVVVRNRPKPDSSADFITVRLPNVLNFEKKPFRPFSEKSLSESLLGFVESQSTMNSEVIKLLNPENVIRWRFQRDNDGNIMKDPVTGGTLYESNSRIVEWEDGSKTLYVGKEAFNCAMVPDQTLLFEENSRDIHVCHGRIHQRMIATPIDLQSKTHDALKLAQFRKFMPKSRTNIMTLGDSIAFQKRNQALRDAEAGAPAKKPRIEGDAPGPTVKWLEDDDVPAGQGESVKDIKKAMKSH